MKTVNVSEAKASLSELLERVLAGEQIAIGRRGKAEVLLVRVERSTEPRHLGWLDVPDYFMSDDFDDPLPDLEEAIYGAIEEP
jgi:prevent-host-death family protein